MKKNLTLLLIITFMITNSLTYSQNLDDLLDAETAPATSYTSATFKASRIVNGHSIEQMSKKQLDFRISHRFGPLSEGAYGLYGLDYSEIHFSLEYGLTDWLMLGAGRGSFNKTYDSFAKFKILRQSTGEANMPISLSYLASTELITMKFENPEKNDDFSNRLTYVQQLLIARKINDNLSAQLSPTYIHRNLVKTELDRNDVFALGIGARYKFSRRVTLNAEYYYANIPNRKLLDTRYYNSASIGVDIDTGGHVFQIMLTNSLGMREGTFIPKTTENWFDKGIHLGFNISRVFSFQKSEL